MPGTVARFTFGEVLIEHATSANNSGTTPVFAQWPCPGCDQRRLIDDALVLKVRPVHETHEAARTVMICAACAARSGITVSSTHGCEPAEEADN